MSITEQRYREGSGERLCKNGEIRCQAISKTRVRHYREEHDDWVTPVQELWPECQCPKAAEQGMFACYFHGGRTAEPRPLRTIMDVLPLDLGEKVKILLSDPSYISRKEDIAILRARQWELLEKLQAKTDSEEAWGAVADALFELRHGNDGVASDLLKQALDTAKEGSNIWQEFYNVEKILKDVTVAEVHTAKELQSMATAEQVGRLMSRIYDILTAGAEKYIEDKQRQSAFLRFIAGELNRATNVSPATVIQLLESGSGEAD